MAQDRFRPHAAAYLVLVKDGQVLLHQRANTNYYDGYYSLVAGHLEGGETAEQCVVREALEEAGITLDLKDLKVEHVLHFLTPTHEYIDIFVTASKWQGEIRNMEPEKCGELRWTPLDNLPDNLVPEVRQALDRISKGEHYSEIGWE